MKAGPQSNNRHHFLASGNARFRECKGKKQHEGYFLVLAGRDSLLASSTSDYL